MHILRKIVFICLTAIMTLLTANFLKDERIEVVNEYCYTPILSNIYYEELTDNTGLTQREVINNVWYNLQQDGYVLQELNVDQFYVDAKFYNGSDLWRYVYDIKSDYVIFLNSIYETSYTGSSYINEGKENN